MIIAPSILASDFSRLGEEVRNVVAAGADWIHIDVMDGQFVPNITMGPQVVQAVRKHTEQTLDVHLMIDAPERYVEAFAKAGADIITIHQEATPHAHRALQMIHQCGLKAGLALNPSTPIEGVSYLVDDLDMVLIMTINPGFGGQSLIPSTVNKVAEMRQMVTELGKPDLYIEVDGGITPETAPLVLQAGATVLVAGTAIFGSNDYETAITALRASE